MKQAAYPYLFLLFLAAFSACAWRAREETFDPYGPRKLVLLRKWKVMSQGKTIGWVREFRIPSPREDIRFDLVENELGQWIGWIDTHGRVFKFFPFEEKQGPVYTGPFEKGVEFLLLPGRALELVPVPAGGRKKGD